MMVEIVDGKIVGYINSKELAEKFGVKQSTIRIWVRRGKLGYLKVGSELYFKEDVAKPERKNKKNNFEEEVVMPNNPNVKIMSPLVDQMLKYLDQSYADSIYKANDLKERFASWGPTSLNVLLGCDRVSNTSRKYRSEFEAFSEVINRQFCKPNKYGFEIHRDGDGKHHIKCINLDDLK